MVAEARGHEDGLVPRARRESRVMSRSASGGRAVWTVEPTKDGVRIDRWLAHVDRLGSRSRALEALAKGRVFLAGVELAADDAGRRLAGGERVEFWVDRPGSAQRRAVRRTEQLPIVYEDRDLIVLDKPAGLLTVPLDSTPDADSLADRVATHWRSHGRRTPAVVHRIDRDTSGLVVFARTAVATSGLKTQFAARRPERIYLAVAHGRPQATEGTWRDWLRWDARALRQRPAARGARGAVEAVCHYRVAETFATTALIEVRLETGKQHQIRVQAWRHGHPLVGERRTWTTRWPPRSRRSPGRRCTRGDSDSTIRSADGRFGSRPRLRPTCRAC